MNMAKPQEIYVLFRDEHGYTQVVRASDIKGVQEFVQEGASMGYLWLEGHFGVGDPFDVADSPKIRGTICPEGL